MEKSILQQVPFGVLNHFGAAHTYVVLTHPTEYNFGKYCIMDLQ